MHTAAQERGTPHQPSGLLRSHTTAAGLASAPCTVERSLLSTSWLARRLMSVPSPGCRCRRCPDACRRRGSLLRRRLLLVEEAVSTSCDPVLTPQAGSRCLPACGTGQLLYYARCGLARCAAAACDLLWTGLAVDSRCVAVFANDCKQVESHCRSTGARAEDANLLVLRCYQTKLSCLPIALT